MSPALVGHSYCCTSSSPFRRSLKYIPAHYLVGEEDSAHLWVLVLSLVDYGLEAEVLQ